MCGISGYFCIHRARETDDLIRQMTRVIAHRGPDDEGISLFAPLDGRSVDLSTDATAGGVRDVTPAGSQQFPHRIAFGHRRFSIVDLSVAAHQPFWSSDRSVCVAFNGEIYNYVELRADLERLGHRFRTTSDTEVLAEAYLEWGTDAFTRFVGFWALSLYDARERRMLLARDRLGKSSLYIGRGNGMLMWSSEIKALLVGGGDEMRAVDHQAISDFVVRGWRDVHERTFFERIDTFPRASWAWIESDGSFEPHRYWAVPAARLAETEISPPVAAATLRDHLDEAIRVRLRADVPVGFELSGGLDSSSLLAVGATAGHDIKAFTIAFPGTSADEEPFARMVYERYPDRVDYNIVEQRVGDFFDAADELVGLMDEPFHSPNIMSVQRIWQQMSGQGIRVTIKGDAGDELFAGYPGVYHSEYLWDLIERRQFRRLHDECVRFSENPTRAFSPAYGRRLVGAALAGLRLYGGAPRAKIGRARAMRSARAAGFSNDVPPQLQPSSSIDDALIDRVGDWQMNHWLRVGNIASMGVPIEIRAPFLDHRVVEFAFSLPTSYLIRDGWMKWILREAMKDMLPDEITWRATKMGFPFPYVPWLTSSKERFFGIVDGTEVPYVDLSVLRTQYDGLVQTNPLLLWRLMVVCMWWRKRIEGKPLDG